jgi:hypothetical protein
MRKTAIAMSGILAEYGPDPYVLQLIKRGINYYLRSWKGESKLVSVHGDTEAFEMFECFKNSPHYFKRGNPVMANSIPSSKKDDAKYRGTLGGIDFVGEYEFDVHRKSIYVTVSMEFPKLNTTEDIYSIVEHELDVDEYGGNDATAYEAENLIIESFKDMGVKGAWK